MTFKHTYKRFLVLAYDTVGMGTFKFSDVRFDGINSGSLYHLKDTGLLIEVDAETRGRRESATYRLSHRVPEMIEKYRWRELG